METQIARKVEVAVCPAIRRPERQVALLNSRGPVVTSSHSLPLKPKVLTFYCSENGFYSCRWSVPTQLSISSLRLLCGFRPLRDKALSFDEHG